MKLDRAAIFFVLVGEPDVRNPEHRVANMRRLFELEGAFKELSATRPIGFKITLVNRRDELEELSLPEDIALAASGGKIPLFWINVTYRAGFDVSELGGLEARFGLLYAGEVDTSNQFAIKR